MPATLPPPPPPAEHVHAQPPRWQQRCASLAEWCFRKYPRYAGAKYSTHYGVYSETPDSLPLVGSMSAGSPVCYLLGCNAWGQASLSYAATLVPHLLGLAPATEDQEGAVRLLAASRYTGSGMMEQYERASAGEARGDLHVARERSLSASGGGRAKL
jgi:glycine/D-amino acid oxidase-like deaminating enzyme